MHLMIDLETLGTRPTSAFQQIGWALFELDGKGVEKSGTILVDPQSCLDTGLTMDWATLQWWLQQDEEAREELRAPGSQVFEALQELIEVVPWDRVEGVWSHGASFDIPVLQNAFALFHEELECPWSRHKVRDTRTLYALTGYERPEDHETTHIAEDDACSQVLEVQEAWSQLTAQGRNP